MTNVAQSLNERMDFDCPVQVHEDGSVTDAPESLYAPAVFDSELDDDSWTLLDGYSGQYGYAGPIMHESEYIGGRLERDILARPGYYVVVASYSLDENPDGTDTDIDGWAVAYHPVMT